MKRLFTPAQITFALAGTLIGIASNVIAEYVAGSNAPVLIALFALTVVAVLVALAYRMRVQRLKAVLKAPITLRNDQDRQNYARRGIIVCVSLYNPFKSQTAKNLSPAERLAAAAAGDYACLDLENSNLQTAIESVTCHASRLEHCWLVSTSAADGYQTGSLPYVPVLIKYLREVKEMKCSFHGSEEYAVSMDDDALVMVKTRDKIEFIFKEAAKLGLSEKDIVADFTGCPRSMTLGMILACLDETRDIQFAGTHYDERGQPIGPLFPILFDFEPRVVEEK